MTTYYLNNVDGSNTSPYDTMAKGAASIDTLDGLVAAGDIIRGAHDHSEDFGVSKDLDFAAGTDAAPIKLVSVNRSTEAYQAGCAIQCTTINHYLGWKGNIRVYGFSSEGNIGTKICNEGPVKLQEFHDCTFKHLRTAATGYVLTTGAQAYQSGKRTRLVACTFDWSANTSGTLSGVIRQTGSLYQEIIAPIFSAGSGSTPGALVEHEDNATYANVGRCLITDADVSFMSTNELLGSQDLNLTLARCKLPASWVLRSSWTDARGIVQLENCEDGTISVPALGLAGYSDYYGTCMTDQVRFRTDGASDGSTPYSFALVATTNTTEIFQPVCTPDMAIWVEAGDSQTVRVYFAGASDRDDDELWIEVHSPNETDSPNTTAQGRYQSTRCDPNATPSALSRSGSTTWDGAGTGTDGGTGQQYAQVTINPAVAGWVVVRACLANKASGATVYVDPFPVVA